MRERHFLYNSEMRQSKLFTKTRKNAPSDEVSKNAELLIRAGFIHKEMAGVYSYLPLGLLVLKKIEEIIREEMNDLGGQELVLPTLQDKNLWEKTQRWDDKKVDNWFKTQLKNDTELGLGFTHEEPLTQIMTEYISSYRDVEKPVLVYQFQVKFRNELRAKSGIIRGREFLMKDLYSFSKNEKDHEEIYEKVGQTYEKIFDRVGLGGVTYFTYASGGSFSKFSHEFQVVTDAGEDSICANKENKKAVNKEVFSGDTLEFTKVKDEKELEELKSVEVGNIFNLGTRFSEALGLSFKDENSEEKPVIMGSYGIGLGRLMGTIVEVLSDDKGIIWPESVSPFKAHLLCISPDDQNAKALAEDLYKELDGKVLYDDRDLRAGEKFADADLIGIPWQIIIGKKSNQDAIEVKNRKTGEVEIKPMTEIVEWLQK